MDGAEFPEREFDDAPVVLAPLAREWYARDELGADTVRWLCERRREAPTQEMGAAT